MLQQIYWLNGEAVTLIIKKISRKNIIVRYVSPSCLAVHVPPWLRQRDWLVWLDTHQDSLYKVLVQGRLHSVDRLPEYIWFQGARMTVAVHDKPVVQLTDNGFMLPDVNWSAQKDLLQKWLYGEAERVLLPRLNQLAETGGWIVPKTALSSAKTFWGVCRSSSIRLNWRLIGAPDWVLEYVCVHELCHLRHRNHSGAFWQSVRAHTPYTDSAKAWLKQFGSELFRAG